MSKLNSITNLPKEDKKMLNSIFLRSFTVFAGAAGMVKAGASGYMVSVMPALKRYYKDDPEGFKDAMVRHTTWYNITQNVGTFAMGLTAAMEKENSEKPDFDTQSISAIKTSLMGPMSGIGDAIFWGVVRVVAAGIGISMASDGSLLGPIVFLLIYNIPSILCRYYMTYLGFSMGSTFITKIYDSGMMKVITKAASTIGLFMVGGMTASNVGFTTKLAIQISADAEPILMQTYLDQLFLGIVPLGITFICFYALNKRIHVNWVMLGILVFSMLCAVLGIV